MYKPEFKAKVVLAALHATVFQEPRRSELASRFGVHPTMMHQW